MTFTPAKDMGNHDNAAAEASSTVTKHSIDVAVIGGGVVGLMVALGLLHRGMRVTVYEQSDEIREISAGFAFTAVARECMERLEPSILEALHRIGQVNRHSHNRYWDGFNPSSKDEAQSENALLFQVSARNLAYQGCLRSHLVREMSKGLPQGAVKFGKHLQDYVDDELNEKVTLRFSDGSFADVDCVIGCDGVFSRTRQLLLGEENLASYPGYSHKAAYRAVIPIADAIAAFGNDKANNQCTHMGPDGVVISYPVNEWTLLNLAIFIHDPEPWSNTKTTVAATRDEVKQHLGTWSPAIRSIVDALPEHLSKWAIYDMAEHPAPTYARGRVCIVGDAAHASTPFLGVGACMGVEDALVVATSLDLAMTHARSKGTSVDAHAISAALQAYNGVRLDRSQWLTQSSREMGDLYQWKHPVAGPSPEKCKEQLESHTRVIWDFDVDGMVAETKREFERRI